MAFIIISIILLVFYSLSPIDIAAIPTGNQYLFLILSGIIGFTAGDYLGFSSFVKLGPRLASLYTTLAPGFALLFGFLLLDEHLNLVGLAGMVITIAGVVLLTISRSEKLIAIEKGFKTDKIGIIFGIGSAFCQGLGLTLSKEGMLPEAGGEDLIAVHANWIRLLGGFGSAFIFSVFSGNLLRYAKPVFYNEKNGTWFMFAGTVFGPVLGVTFSLITVSKIDVAAAQTIFALLPVFVLPLNYLFYRDRITLISILAALISICGVLILIWSNQIFLSLFS